MTAPAHPSRKSTLRDLSSRLPKIPVGNNGDGLAHVPTSSYFGINTFGARQMRDKLPKDVYAKLVAAIRHGKKLDLEIAPTVAQVIKEWAVDRGVTHFTHWFQPQTG
ncbi:MAG TPA: glutamine synthetase III, partial [Gammaproteobacteria bacterium]|nr:glutamine synthetase III [Gammaproteobacteria bacterium]